MTEQTEWFLSSDQRKSTVSRVAANIATIAFSQGQQVSDSDAKKAAENAERKAYTVARVEAKTTTGVRPHSETYEAYTRCFEPSGTVSVASNIDFANHGGTAILLQEACSLGSAGCDRREQADTDFSTKWYT